MPTLAELITVYETRATCIRGHDRATHARRYERPGYGAPIWTCLMCQRIRRQERAEAAQSDRHPDDILWDEFCRTIDQRIAEAREDAPPACRACEARAATRTRSCSRCRIVKVLDEFTRDKNKPLGYGYVCRPCREPINARSNLERKRRALRAVLGVSA